MGNASKRRYDGKHRVTRAFLADYIIIKEFSQRAGLSMAEALHRLIARQVPEAKPMVRPASKPAFRVTTPIALRQRLAPVIATNGSKVSAYRIKTKGVRYA
ncbi:hypothetical protein ES708_18200 [subsurface metagenome]